MLNFTVSTSMRRFGRVRRAGGKNFLAGDEEIDDFVIYNSPMLQHAPTPTYFSRTQFVLGVCVAGHACSAGHHIKINFHQSTIGLNGKR